MNKALETSIVPTFAVRNGISRSFPCAFAQDDSVQLARTNCIEELILFLLERGHLPKDFVYSLQPTFNDQSCVIAITQGKFTVVVHRKDPVLGLFANFSAEPIVISLAKSQQGGWQ